MPKILSKDRKNNIKSLILNGEDTKTIVQRTGASKATINRGRAAINPNYEKAKGGGQRIVPLSIYPTLRFKFRSGKIDSAKDAQRYLNCLGYPIGHTGALKIMNSIKFHAHAKKNKPLLRRNHVKNRYKWAKENLDWTVEDWKKVVFSDETKINM